MEVIPELPLVVDSTMLTTFRACPRKFYWEFVLGLRPTAMSVHLHAGGAFAHGMEAARRAHYIGGKTHEESTWAGVAAFIGYWGSYEPVDDTPKTFFNTLNAFVSYLDTYPFHLDHIQPLLEGAFEYSFTIPTEAKHPSGSPFLFGGKIDLLGRYRGLPAVVDEKTTTQLGATYPKKWQMRGQFLGYCWAVTSGLGIDNVETAVIRATAIRKSGCEHLEIPQPYSKDLIEKWAVELEKTLARISQCWQENYWPYDFGDSCASFGVCPYTLLCTSKSGKESQWFGDYTVRRWNPVLRNPISDLELEMPVGVAK